MIIEIDKACDIVAWLNILSDKMTVYLNMLGRLMKDLILGHMAWLSHISVIGLASSNCSLLNNYFNQMNSHVTNVMVLDSASALDPANYILFFTYPRYQIFSNQCAITRSGCLSWANMPNQIRATNYQIMSSILINETTFDAFQNLDSSIQVFFNWLTTLTTKEMSRQITVR